MIEGSNFKLLWLNLVNSKSSGLEVLFRIISSSNYRKVELLQKSVFYQTKVLGA